MHSLPSGTFNRRCVGLDTGTETQSQLHRCTYARNHMSVQMNGQLCKCSNAQMHKCTNPHVQMNGHCANAQMHKCTNARMNAILIHWILVLILNSNCIDAHMHRRISAQNHMSVQMLKCTTVNCNSNCIDAQIHKTTCANESSPVQMHKCTDVCQVHEWSEMRF